MHSLCVLYKPNKRMLNCKFIFLMILFFGPRTSLGVLINKDRLMRRECNCHPINHHCLQLCLASSDCAKSHNSLDNEYYWQNICKCSNCISYEPQTVGIDQSKMFDFDAIQIIEDEELQQLPEAVNREIVKNSQEIVFEEKEKVSERIKLNYIKSELSHNQEIISFSEEKEEDILMQRAMEKDAINKETKKDNQESVFEEKKKDLMQTTLIKMNKDKDKILKYGQKIVFKEDKRDFSEKNIIRLKEEKADILKNSQEIMYEETKDEKDFLRKNMILLNEKNADNLKNYQEAIFEKEEGALKRKLIKLDEGNSDILKNRIYDEKEQLPFMKIEKNAEDIKHLIRHTVYKPKQEYRTRSNEFAKKDYEACLKKNQRLHNRKYQLIKLANQDKKNIEKNTEKNIFMEKEQHSQKRFDRSLSNDFLTINDKRFFKESIRNKNNKLIAINQDKKNPKSDPFSIEEHNSSKKYHRNYTDYFVTIDDRSKEIAIDNVKNIRILERNQKSMQQIPKYSVISLDDLNSNSIFGQQLDYNFLKWENASQVKQHDNIKIENEKILRKSLSCHLIKISIQDKLYSNDNCSIYDLSPESDFCEGGSEGCREQLMKNTLKDVENTNSVESNLSRENISDIDNPKDSTKNHVIEAIASINNNIRDDELMTSSHFSLSFNKSIDDGSNLVKYAAASNIKEQITCVDCGEQNIHEAKKKFSPNISSRKLINNLDVSEEPFSIAEKQLICRKNCIQNNDEELTVQKSSFLNVNTSCKHFVKDIECPEFDDAITAEKQIDPNITKTNERKTGDFLSSNTLCENVVNDIVILDHLKQYSSSALTEEQPKEPSL